MPKPGKGKAKAGARGGGTKAATLQPPLHSPPAAPRVAWPGVVNSNKDEAMARFLEKKRARGESLTEAQLQLIARFHAPEHVAAAKEVAASAPSFVAPAPEPAAAGHKRKRDSSAPAASSSSASPQPPPPPQLSLSAKLSMSLDDLSAAHRRGGAGGSKSPSTAAQPHPPVSAAPPPAAAPAPAASSSVFGMPVSKKKW